jgi:hypothetical protein
MLRGTIAVAVAVALAVALLGCGGDGTTRVEGVSYERSDARRVDVEAPAATASTADASPGTSGTAAGDDVAATDPPGEAAAVIHVRNPSRATVTALLEDGTGKPIATLDLTVGDGTFDGLEAGTYVVVFSETFPIVTKTDGTAIGGGTTAKCEPVRLVQGDVAAATWNHGSCTMVL